MPTKTIQTGVCRFDIKDRKVHGFMVRIMRRGKMYQEFLSDKKHGGKRKAKAAAIARHEELEAVLPKSINQKGRATVRNSSGKVGVHLAHDIERRWPDTEYFSYVASWLSDEGKRINVKFSWNKYGEDAAWELACITRDRELRDREEIMRIYKRRLSRKAKRTSSPQDKQKKPTKKKPVARKKAAVKKKTKRAGTRKKASQPSKTSVKSKQTKRR